MCAGSRGKAPTLESAYHPLANKSASTNPLASLAAGMVAVARLEGEEKEISRYSDGNGGVGGAGDAHPHATVVSPGASQAATLITTRSAERTAPVDGTSVVSPAGSKGSSGGKRLSRKGLALGLPSELLGGGDVDGEGAKAGVYSDDSCSVCLDEYEEGEQLLQLTCGHVFHRACINLWLKGNCVCPCCRWVVGCEAWVSSGEVNSLLLLMC